MCRLLRGTRILGALALVPIPPSVSRLDRGVWWDAAPLGGARDGHYIAYSG